ncbi:hypothetical protein ACERK3_09535 [Phycisphaerales bacterium AB-hyl4]|uniref:C2H2-type domain-containing protein n=1 Tax=Natronomicrosphaera hydrolytica TaxID=3242702 RepID=A0ABV4U5C8_9BACT
MQIAENIEMEARCCPSCGIQYAGPVRFFESRREQGGSWYCPNGHSLSFTETEADRLKRQLNTKTRRIEHLEGEVEHTTNRLRATRGHLTRVKKRVASGVCPCCNRSFENLHRHMKDQHPEFANDSQEQPAP